LKPAQAEVIKTLSQKQAKHGIAIQGQPEQKYKILSEKQTKNQSTGLCLK
jgi:hypothetical protein